MTKSALFAEMLQQFRPWIAPVGFLVATVICGVLAETLLLKRLKRLANRTEGDLDDLFLGAVNRHLPLWLVLGGVSMAVQASPLGENSQTLIQKIVVIGFILSVTLSASKFVRGLVRIYSSQFTASATAATLTENLTQLVVVGMGTLLLLSNLGISITPILTALGVGSLAVALALQDTLSNLFAGIHIVVSRLVEVGNYIKLDSGQEGYIVDVGWRVTRIRELPNNIIIIPNFKLSQAVVTNYHQPDKELAVLVQVGVSHNSDLGLVEKATIEVGREVMREVKGGVPDFIPFIRYNTFGDSSINFTVNLKGREFEDRHLLTHEFIKRLHTKYKEERIEIPLPQRVVHLMEQKS